MFAGFAWVLVLSPLGGGIVVVAGTAVLTMATFEAMLSERYSTIGTSITDAKVENGYYHHSGLL